MRAYMYDNLPGAKHLPHDSGVPVSLDELAKIGVLYWHIPVTNWEKDVNAIADAREYKNRDTVQNSRELLGEEFEKKNEAYYVEHMHEDEEIRYSLAGGGYFDVRELKTDTFVRIHVTQGDMLVLPAGIYHRYCLDEGEYAHNLRLFKDEPKWIAHNRSSATDVNPFRKEYLDTFAPAAAAATVH